MRGARGVSGADDADRSAIQPNEASDGSNHDAQQAEKRVEHWVLWVLNRVAALDRTSVALVDGRVSARNCTGGCKNG